MNPAAHRCTGLDHRHGSRIGPGDEFALRSSNARDPRILRVGPVGDLLLPAVGPIPVAGLTLSEAEALVRQRAAVYLVVREATK